MGAHGRSQVILAGEGPFQKPKSLESIRGEDYRHVWPSCNASGPVATVDSWTHHVPTHTWTACFAAPLHDAQYGPLVSEHLEELRQTGHSNFACILEKSLTEILMQNP